VFCDLIFKLQGVARRKHARVGLHGCGCRRHGGTKVTLEEAGEGRADLMRIGRTQGIV